MIDLDASVVVALLTPEDRSAMGIKQRHHGLSSQNRQAAGEQFERLQQGGGELRSLNRDRSARKLSCSRIRPWACVPVISCI